MRFFLSSTFYFTTTNTTTQYPSDKTLGGPHSRTVNRREKSVTLKTTNEIQPVACPLNYLNYPVTLMGDFTSNFTLIFIIV